MGIFQPGPVRERIELANEPEFDLGGMKVRPAERLVYVNGEHRELQPRVMQVLVALAKARPQVVSRERLQDLCWDGRVVSDDALNRCVLALRHLAQHFSPQPFAIETVPRVGHRLVENGHAAGAVAGRTGPKRRRLVALVAALLLAAAGLFLWRQDRTADEPASIAVLPFRNLSSGEPYFAEGISEEILAQLAREPAFRVAGSRSSRHLAAETAVEDIASRLDVEYVVEGTVRTQGDRVRVSTQLVRAKDGTHLWSASFDGTLDDIFAIQRSIGTAIAGALQQKLVRSPALSGPLITNGKAYNLYLTARGLLRTRARKAGPVAVDLLRDAIQTDPGYAPAWARLGEATLLAGALNDSERFAASAAKAQGYARHAFKLAPDLPEAHRVLGGILGFGTSEAVAHLRRAAQLEPNNAENLIGLGAAYGASGEFEKELAAYRRAWELEPLWFRTVGSSAITTAEMGDRAGAEAFVLRALPVGGIEQNLTMAKVAWSSGDFSEAVRRWSMIIAANSARWSETARRNRDEELFALGLKAAPPPVVPRPLDQRHLWRITMTEAPEASQWRLRNRDPVPAAVYRDENHVAAKLMLNSGRARELVAAYDGPGGLAGIRRARLRPDQLMEAPVVALALQQAGRRAEAERMLRQARQLTAAIDRRGRVPFWFDADAAALLAVGGRKEEALSRLGRAFDRGWRHGRYTDLRNFADEPAFRSLKGDARFERIHRQIEAHRARERRETAEVLKRQS